MTDSTKRIPTPAEEHESGVAIARVSRRRIVIVAAKAFVSGRINAEQYRKRIERANATGADAPYYGLRTDR